MTSPGVQGAGGISEDIGRYFCKLAGVSFIHIEVSSIEQAYCNEYSLSVAFLFKHAPVCVPLLTWSYASLRTLTVICA